MYVVVVVVYNFHYNYYYCARLTVTDCDGHGGVSDRIDSGARGRNGLRGDRSSRAAYGTTARHVACTNCRRRAPLFFGTGLMGT